jgi:Bacteriophage Lambda NinG protein
MTHDQLGPLSREAPPDVVEVLLKRRETVALREKSCKACRQPFTPRRPIQPYCGYACEVKAATAAVEKKQARAAKEDRKQTRAQLEAIKTVPMLKKEAQAAFNKYVRLRDAGKPCISCDALPPDLSGLHAGRDAGHYRSTGSADHLRFNEDNCHAQCVKCNQWGAGMAVEYRIGLIKRIGLERVEALESNHDSQKWTRDGLRAIRDEYRAKCRVYTNGKSSGEDEDRASLKESP